MTRGQRPLVEQWLDLAVYAPIGLIALVREELPAVVQRGRDRAEQQVQVYRFFGQMAVAYGKAEARKRREAARTESHIADVIATTAHDIVPDVADAVPPVEDDEIDPMGVAGDDLALAAVVPFEGYDTLAAVHVVERLGRLTPDELRHVRAYEAAHRNRRTVLGKLDQLLR
jgi:hypothetical protein